jgi:hypothetical protein
MEGFHRQALERYQGNAKTETKPSSMISKARKISI